MLRLHHVTIVSCTSSLDFCLDPAVDSAGAEGRYTPLSTGLLFGVFICRLLHRCEALQGKMKIKVLAMQQAATPKGTDL
jgi:hypothetical protein